MKKTIILLLVSMIVSGCSQVSENTDQTNTPSTVVKNDSFDESFYPILKLNANSGRNEYYNNFNLTDDYHTIGRELEVLSTKHFSTDDYYMAEGQIMDYATMNKDLMLWANKDRPYSLQPKQNETIEGHKQVIMTSTVYELDFYQKKNDDYVLKGLSFGIVIDPIQKKEDNTIGPIEGGLSSQYIEEFSKQAIETLYQYVQESETFADYKDVPVLIAVYQATNTQESLIDGRYILQAKCDGDVGKITNIDYQHVIFSSEEATAIDPVTANEFGTFRSTLKKNSLEAVGAVGYGRYRNGQISTLNITVNVNVKTYVELEYLIGLAAEDLNSAFSNPTTIVAQVKSQDGLEAVIIKERNSDAKSYLLNY